MTISLGGPLRNRSQLNAATACGSCFNGLLTIIEEFACDGGVLRVVLPLNFRFNTQYGFISSSMDDDYRRSCPFGRGNPGKH